MINHILKAFLIFCFVYFAITHTTLTKEQAYEKSQKILEKYCDRAQLDFTDFKTDKNFWKTGVAGWTIPYRGETNKHEIDIKVPIFGFSDILNIAIDNTDRDEKPIGNRSGK